MMRVASVGPSASRLFPAGADVIEDAFVASSNLAPARLLPLVADGASLSNKPLPRRRFAQAQLFDGEAKGRWSRFIAHAAIAVTSGAFIKNPRNESTAGLYLGWQNQQDFAVYGPG